MGLLLETLLVRVVDEARIDHGVSKPFGLLNGLFVKLHSFVVECMIRIVILDV